MNCWVDSFLQPYAHGKTVLHTGVIYILLDCIKHSVNIDPPYNTGNDFVYSDDYKDNIENYFRITGQKNEEGYRNSNNTESSGRYHTNWLNMMYPRLRLARNLLKDDGVIYISIDDNEVDNLKKVCNEIFGEENFVSLFIWKKRTGSNDSQNGVSNDHDYILCYFKMFSTVFNGVKKDFINLRFGLLI